MLVNINFTKKEAVELLKTLVIVVDTAEKENSHIISYFKKHKIKYIRKTLSFGDYSVMIPASEEFGIRKDYYLNNVISIERKNSLEEISNNFCNGRQRFNFEFARSKGKIHLIVEGCTFNDLVNKVYATEMSKESFIATWFTFQARYDLTTQFISKEASGEYIFNTLKYYLREHLIEGNVIYRG